MRTTAIQKHIVLLAGLDDHLVTIVKPVPQFTDCLLGDGHQPFLIALSDHSDVTFLQIQVTELEVNEFRHPKPTGKKHLDDGEIALPFFLRKVYGSLKLVNLFRGKHFRQMLAKAWRL